MAERVIQDVVDDGSADQTANAPDTCSIHGVPEYVIDYPKRDQERRLRCPNAVNEYDWSGRFLTKRERSMIALIGKLSDVPGWEQKVFDKEVCVAWWSERAKEQDDFTETMFDMCLMELRRNAKTSLSTGFAPALDANAVVFKSSNMAIDRALIHDLKDAVAPLEDACEANSNSGMLDLVDPNLYPLVYGRSLATEHSIPLDDAVMFCSSKGKVIPTPKPTTDHDCNCGSWMFEHGYSSRFQWLPCEVRMDTSGDAKVVSYINNLNPGSNRNLYNAIEKVISKAIPMWNSALTEMFRQERNEYCNGWDPPSQANYEPRIPLAIWSDSHWSQVMFSGLRAVKLIIPDPTMEAFREREDIRLKTRPLDLRTEFDGHIQVIVKLSNVYLTPDQPEYEGEPWHIEGQLNEHICATALLFYDDHNVKTSYVAFRERTDRRVWPEKWPEDSESSFTRSECEHFEMLFDFKRNESAAIQNLGSVAAKEGRMLVFPNVLQHRIESFRLEDTTKPGHRKVLALHLVDPYLRIPSTANVPPQQKDWWAKMITGLDRIGKLPQELVDEIVSHAGDFLIDPKEAEQLRADLANEKTDFGNELNEAYECQLLYLRERAD